MGVSRRSFISLALAGTAIGALSVKLPAGAVAAGSATGDVVGKITVGYQGWFACSGDKSPVNAWWHWSKDWSKAPSPATAGIKSWPDMRDYATGYPTGFSALGDGRSATLFSSHDQQTIDTHFRWMRENGCDTAALQRFNPNGQEGPIRDAITAKVRTAAEAQGRKFYVMYDVSGWTNMQPELKADWTDKMSAMTSSPAYAKQNGKPVVGIWGFGFNDGNHPWSAATCTEVINWFKSQGCYVMGGIPTHWRDGDQDSRPGFLDTYHTFDMISPWMVGRIGNAADSDNFHDKFTVPDKADCDAHGIDYQPCVLPGDLQERQRAHGDFMWRQFYNMARAGVSGTYISMFDEYNEGNQIAKTAATAADVPAGSGILALDHDGTACSSDYYLRITADGGKMLKGQIPLTATRPTPPIAVTTVPNPPNDPPPPSQTPTPTKDPAPPTTTTPVPAGGVVFYQDVFYGGGSCRPLAKGDYTMARLEATGMPNDWASSVKIPAGWTVTMYADDHFSGPSWVRTSNTPNFVILSPNANDKVSSCRIR